MYIYCGFKHQGVKDQSRKSCPFYWVSFLNVYKCLQCSHAKSKDHFNEGVLFKHLTIVLGV